jgi:hypothetical protein
MVTRGGRGMKPRLILDFQEIGAAPVQDQRKGALVARIWGRQRQELLREPDRPWALRGIR